jgi:hypothetical protein
VLQTLTGVQVSSSQHVAFERNFGWRGPTFSGLFLISGNSQGSLNGPEGGPGPSALSRGAVGCGGHRRPSCCAHHCFPDLHSFYASFRSPQFSMVRTPPVDPRAAPALYLAQGCWWGVGGTVIRLAAPTIASLSFYDASFTHMGSSPPAHTRVNPALPPALGCWRGVGGERSSFWRDILAFPPLVWVAL